MCFHMISNCVLSGFFLLKCVSQFSNFMQYFTTSDIADQIHKFNSYLLGGIGVIKSFIRVHSSSLLYVAMPRDTRETLSRDLGMLSMFSDWQFSQCWNLQSATTSFQILFTCLRLTRSKNLHEKVFILTKHSYQLSETKSDNSIRFVFHKKFKLLLVYL